MLSIAVRPSGGCWRAAHQKTQHRRAARRAAAAPPPQAILDFFKAAWPGGSSNPLQQSRAKTPEQLAVQRLLSSIEGADRGLGNSPEQREEVLAAAAELARLGGGTTTTGSDLSATWKLLWTTEKVRRVPRVCMKH